MSRLVFDLFQPKVNEGVFLSGTIECKDFYGDTNEELPPGMLEQLGKNSHTTCFVDDNHPGNVIDWRFREGFLIYVMNAPIIWLSKKYNTVEIITFGSEFMVMCIARDIIVAIH